jgi:hypothetical protein
VEGGTAGTDITSGPKAHQVKNQEIFRNKWRADLHDQPSPPSRASREELASIVDRAAR